MSLDDYQTIPESFDKILKANRAQLIAELVANGWDEEFADSDVVATIYRIEVFLRLINVAIWLECDFEMQGSHHRIYSCKLQPDAQTAIEEESPDIADYIAADT